MSYLFYHTLNIKRDAPPPLSPGAQILSISCIFWENLSKSYVGAPPWELAPPTRGNPGSTTAYSCLDLRIYSDKECRRSPKGDGFVGSKFSDEKECQKWASYLVQDAIAKDGYMTQTSANLDNNYLQKPPAPPSIRGRVDRSKTRRRALVLLAVQRNRKGNSVQCSLLW